MRIVPYLTFAGNAREAMIFYQKCLGGKLKIQKVGDSPLGKQLPKKMKDTVLHASLTKKGFALMASDMVDEKGLQKGNAISILLNCESEKEIKDLYKRLSGGGEQTHPLETTFFGALLGNLTDKYGNNWVLYYKQTKKQKHENKQDHFLDNYKFDIPF